MKSVPCNRRLGIKAKKCLYEGVIIPTALYEAEVWDVYTIYILREYVDGVHMARMDENW